MRALIAAALLAASATAAAGPLPRDILGLVLDAPVPLPECPKSRFVTSPDQRFDPCIRRLRLFEDPRQHEPVTLEHLSVPSWTTSVSATIRDGVLGEIRIHTPGRWRQDDVLASLIEKYGEPATRDVEVLRNGAGQEFESLNATWSDGDVRVTLYGISTRADEGLVIINTLRERDAADRARADQRAREPRL